MTTPIYVDATMLYRWRHLSPVGIVRLERMLAKHLRFSASVGRATFVIWESGYRPASEAETSVLDRLLTLGVEPSDESRHTIATPAAQPSSRRVLSAARRGGLRALSKLPDHLRPFGEQAAWSIATFGVESARYVRRARIRQADVKAAGGRDAIGHSIDLSRGADLVAVGLGWEYIDHESMYLLSKQHGVRIHMPAFDLIPVLMPQMNAGQSHLVHRYYAEMAHYASTITSISEATAAALRRFYEVEELPTPKIETNPLPAFDTPRAEHDEAMRRHRFEGQTFVLSVSTIEVRKNHLILAKVWAECIAEGHDLPRLVLVGRVGWDVNELMQWVFNAPQLQDRVTIASDVEDSELTELYRDALFTVFPSRIEGWGLPITESLALGKACLHADDPAQHEASQGLMPSLHPDDFIGWKREILRLLDEPGYRTSLEAAIDQRFVRRSADMYCTRFEDIVRAAREESG